LRKRKVRHTIDKTNMEYRCYCEICGEQIKEGSGYSVLDGKLEWERGEDYPEGSTGKKYVVDLCVPCIEKKVIPTLVSAFPMLKVRQHDRDFYEFGKHKSKPRNERVVEDWVEAENVESWWE
jgi:hypothetical protein